MGPNPYGAGQLDRADELEMEDRLDTDETYNAVDADATVDTEDDASREIAETRAQIERTRAEMSETIEAIREKLEPSHLVQQAKDGLYEATVGKAQTAMGQAVDSARDFAGDAVDYSRETARDIRYGFPDAVRSNPLPLALIGLGVGWLLLEARKQGAREERYRSRSYRTEYDYESVYDRGYDTSMVGSYDGDFDQSGGRGMRDRIGERVGDVKERAGEMVDQVRDRAGDMADRVRERAGDVAERVQHRAHDVRERAGEMAGRVRERTGEMAGQVRETAAEAKERAAYRASLAKLEARRVAEGASDMYQRVMQDSPLAIGAVGVIAGAAAAMMIPETEVEHRWMGETRDRIMDQAQDRFGEVKSKVQNVAGEVKDRVQTVATEAVQNVKQTVMDSVQDVKATVKDTATQAAKDQGLTGSGMMGGQTSMSTSESPVNETGTGSQFRTEGSF